MRINNNQLVVVEKVLVSKFVNATVLFLKEHFTEWASTKTDSEITAQVQSLLETAKEVKIRAEINVMRFIICVVKCSLIFPVPPELISILMNGEANESVRVEIFCINALSGIYKLNELKINI